MSLAFSRTIAKWGRLVTSIRKDRKGVSHAAKPPSNKTVPIRILGSTLLLMRCPSETRVRRITFRVVDGLSYVLIVVANNLGNEESILDFGPGKGFKQSQDALWIPFLDHTLSPLITASLTGSRAWITLDATHRTPQSHKDMA